MNWSVCFEWKLYCMWSTTKNAFERLLKLYVRTIYISGNKKITCIKSN